MTKRGHQTAICQHCKRTTRIEARRLCRSCYSALSAKGILPETYRDANGQLRRLNARRPVRDDVPFRPQGDGGPSMAECLRIFDQFDRDEFLPPWAKSNAKPCQVPPPPGSPRRPSDSSTQL